MSRDFSRESWRLKLARAKKHFEELDAKVAGYVSRNPYGARRVPWPGDRKRHVWRFALAVTEQPDREIAVIMGDVVHNLRSALDHLAVALAGRKNRDNAGFPVEDPNAWTKNDAGVFVPKKKETGERFARVTRGIPPEAMAIIEDLQPYRGRIPEDHPFRMLSRLENADKHRNLLPVVLGLNDVDSIMLRRGAPVSFGWRASGFCEDGAIVAEHMFPPRDIPEESEVEVKVRGIPVVALRIGRKRTETLALWRLRRLLQTIPESTFDDLERFLPEPGK